MTIAEPSSSTSPETHTERQAEDAKAAPVVAADHINAVPASNADADTDADAVSSCKPAEDSGAAESAAAGLSGKRKQVRTSSLTLAESGYLLRSIDYPSQTLWIGFSGDIKAAEESLDTDQQQQQQGAQAAAKDDALTISVLAVVGVFTLDLHSYVLVACDSRCRGTVCGKDVYEVKSVVALPLDYSAGRDVLQTMLGGANALKHRKSSLALQPLSANPSPITEPNQLPVGLDDVALENGGGISNTSSRAHSEPSTAPKESIDQRSFIDVSANWLSPQIAKLLHRGRAGSVGTAGAQSPPATPASRVPGSDAEVQAVNQPVGGESDKQKNGVSSVQRMEMRIIEELARIFGTSGIFYSYDYDLTRSLQEKDSQPPVAERAPLAHAAARDYWFNWHFQQRLLANNAHEWALPLIQGCVQVAACDIKTGESFQVCVLSRRNWRRIGMRYERRGINSEGYVANFVETEQILAVEVGGMQTYYASFIQTRGSMPFYWKQTPSGLQPAPVVLKSDDENARVCALHLQREIDRLGRQVLVNLVEHKGREAVVGSKYASIVGQCVSDELIDARMVRYIPWDFHHETRGMKYENLKQLLEQLGREISDMGYYWCATEHAFTKQSSVFRVNCMDCLDRTNVVQSTVGKYVLNEQLVRLGVHVAPESGLAAYGDLESTLNHLWANNGDYISRQYAGTSAMKGDFTRTGKRNFSGLMSDASYSLARLWISTFRDYFSQSVLDYVMGYQKAADVFRTLVDLRSREPDHILELARAREAAIEASIAIVVHDGENVQISCIAQSPITLDTLKIRGTADAVFILTTAAIYICRYHYQTEKVSEVLRIELSGLVRIQNGTYITDTQVPQSLDPLRNHGLVLYFKSGAARLNSGSPQIKPGGVDSITTEHQSDSSPNPSVRGIPVATPEDITMVALDREESGSSLTRTPETQPVSSHGHGHGHVDEHYVSCKLVCEAQVVMQRIPGEESTPVGPSSSNQPADLSLARLASLENQSPDILAECLCSLILSATMEGNPVDKSRFIVDSPIISVSSAKHSLTLVDKVSNRIHKALWI
ncbi:hypothetical protein GGI07_002113 [Coemansia sp. Benny D115]|nr:hypothetical protein GGI07_002113 [Coemansia sp. Benny D115]